jgi:hypothetical protein
MFVPGVNGSIIPSAPSGSKLKGAYKNSKKRKMPYGGIKSSIENISPQGDVQYNVSKNLKNFRAGLQGSVNAPGMYAGSVTPTLSYSKNKFSSYVSPNSLGASVEGDKAYLNYNQTREGQTMYRDASAGYNTDKVNLNAGVNFRNNSLESGQISGSYNLNPNLAITGNYGVSRGESGLNTDYFAGIRFNKTFEAGGTRYVPPSKRPMTFTSNAPSTTDNTFVARPYMPTKPIPKPVIPPAPVKKEVKKPAPTKVKVTPAVDQTSYSDNTKVVPGALYGVTNEKRLELKTGQDYKQAQESILNSPVGTALDVLPTPAASFLRSMGSIDNRSGNFTENQKKSVAYAIAKAEERGSTTNEEGYTGSFGYDDYPGKRKGFNALHNIRETDGKFSDRVSTIKESWPTLTTQTTLGKASFKKQNDKDYLVHDKYNFDEHSKDPSSIMEYGEVIGHKLGVEAETNIVIPKSYVDEAKKQILAEKTAKPVVPKKEEVTPKVDTKIAAPTKTTVPAKSRLQETYQTTAPKKTYSPAKTTVTSKTSTTPRTPTTKSSSTLTGERLKVQNYQKMLNEKYGANLETDGAWGKNTQEAYEKFVLSKKMEQGGKVSNDKQMVNGVASILRDVKSKENRLQLANKLAKQFNREKVDYNLSDFLNKSKVKK